MDGLRPKLFFTLFVSSVVEKWQCSEILSIAKMQTEISSGSGVHVAMSYVHAE
jgi:hypothetical protein